MLAACNIIQEFRNPHRHTVGSYNKGAVQMHIALGHAAGRVAEQTGDRQLGKAEVARYAGKGVTENMWRHVTKLRRLWCKRQDLARYDVGRAAGGVGMGKLMGVEQLFEGRHFDREVIILCVRWYLRFKLSLRDLVEMMAERGLSLAHTTIMRWVWRYAPEFEKRWRR